MIDYKINVPFSIGDTVWIREEHEVYHSIDCPFCHGNSIYYTGLRKISYTKIGSVNEPWIIECETCNKRGFITEKIGDEINWRKAIVTGVKEVHSFILRNVYTVEYEDGTKGFAIGQNIFTNKPEGGDA